MCLGLINNIYRYIHILVSIPPYLVLLCKLYKKKKEKKGQLLILFIFWIFDKFGLF